MGKKKLIKADYSKDYWELGDIFDKFLYYKEAEGLAPDTLRNYQLSYNVFCSTMDYNSNTDLNSINDDSIIDFVRAIKCKDLSLNSINHYLRDIRSFLNWSLGKDYLTHPVKVTLLRVQEEIPKTFRDSAIVSLIDKPRKQDSFVEWRTWAIVNWVVATGNRQGTICAIKLGDLDFKKKTCNLSHTKSKKTQIVPLSKSLVTAIKYYINTFRADCSPEDWLFPQTDNSQLTTKALHESFVRYCKHRGVSQTNMHGLRHNFAANYIASGGSPLKLQQILGHATLTMTEHYVKLYGQDLNNDIDDHALLENIKANKGRKKSAITRND